MEKRKITVVAKSGCICPRENPREPVITDSEPVEVNESVYYSRLLADGSLKEVKTEKVKKGSKPTETGDGK
ncbi:MAG TPA: hypothetical protein VHO70_02775 [Chitinispirillaceae bacterium]|nr:hypothetical protein [Chitinispirillaceae bacterium]